MERCVDRNESISVHHPKHIKTFANLVDLHISDMREAQKQLWRSQKYALDKLKVELGNTAFDRLNHEQLVTDGRKRAKQGAGSVTLGAEFSYINTVISHVAAIQGIFARWSISLKKTGTPLKRASGPHISCTS